MRYFYSSFAIMVIGLIAAYFLGGLTAIYITFLLTILEISLSFDNAVVNAKVLETMDPIWQKRFIIFGIPIAVFGMRLVFPLAIVSFVTGMGMIETLQVAMNQPDEYEKVLKSTESTIFAFGGAFLLMVFLDFFFEEKEIKWVTFVEGSKLMKKASTVNSIELIMAIITGILLGHITHDFGVVLAFDASFSFDGVIGAFALTSNIFIIMIGLGAGAMFVRSMTIFFVEHKTLSHFRYLEHGAHYAIGTLAIIMLMKINMHISEMVTGTIGIGLILIAFLHSLWENKKVNDNL
ncbi:MAG: DUF475 domain-containing protein [Sulfuricurvum sp.]|nr:DUF475 domain-containing protein [Sulfuricurvum sp.]